MKTTDDYVQHLIVALHARRVPPLRIGEIVAEVDSHLAETGERPREAFGEPRDYARAIAPEPPRRGPRLVLELLLGGITGFVACVAVVATLAGERPLGIGPLVTIPVAVVLIAATAWFAQHLRPTIRDPRTGRRLGFGGGEAFAGVVAVALAAIAVVAFWAR